MDLVPASAGLLLAFGVGAALGPIGATALLGAIGPSGFYLFGAIVSFAVGGFGFWRMTQRAAPSMEDQGAFVVAPRSSRSRPSWSRSEFVEDEEEASDDGEDDDQSGDTDPCPGGKALKTMAQIEILRGQSIWTAFAPTIGCVHTVMMRTLACPR